MFRAACQRRHEAFHRKIESSTQILSDDCMGWSICISLLELFHERVALEGRSILEGGEIVVSEDVVLMAQCKLMLIMVSDGFKINLIL